MFAEERRNEILSTLTRDGSVRVAALSRTLGVTQDCIRKDLKILENDGKLKRTHGGAILSTDYPLSRDVIDRKQVHLEQKRIIAAKALEMIRDRETIFLDVSTTNILLAELIAKSSRRIIVVSNMIDILQILAGNANVTTIGTGGHMFPTINGFMGIETANHIREYSFDRAFIGCCGIDTTDCSLTTFGAEDGLTKAAAIAAGRHRYIVMEHEKFYYNECYKFAHFDDIDGIISDENPKGDVRKALETEEVKVY
jgi:DeoR/GlpR family transcriptional regulator of sugar metabolism